jgi:hypothetical protein
LKRSVGWLGNFNELWRTPVRRYFPQRLYAEVCFHRDRHPVAHVPDAERVNGKAILRTAKLLTLWLPPGLPDQPGTAQTAAGLLPTGQVLVAPTASPCRCSITPIFPAIGQ